jgi:hypothetical protein
MQTDKELFDLMKETFPQDPREDFVSATEIKLRQSARKLSRKRTFKRLTFVTSGFLAFSFAVSWFFFFNGKEVVNHALTSLGEHQSTATEKHKDPKKNNPVVQSAENENLETTQKENQETTQKENQEIAQKALQVKDENGKVYATAYFPSTMDVRFEPYYWKFDDAYGQKIYVTKNGTEYYIGMVLIADASRKDIFNRFPYQFLKQVDDKIIFELFPNEVEGNVLALNDPSKIEENAEIREQVLQILSNM